MKLFFCIALCLATSFGAVGQAVSSLLPLPGEAVCGYAGSFQRVEAGRVKTGLSVELLAGEAVVDCPVPMRFRIVQKPRDTPVDDLQIEHEKHIHVIGVRDDLGEFIHLHPQRAAPGLWEVVHVFTNAGRYLIWSDVKHRGTVYSFKHPWLEVAGAAQSVAPSPLPRREATVSGYRLRLSPAPATLRAGVTNAFELAVHDEFGNAIATEFYLGALMHLVIVKADLSSYAHAHAEEHVKSRQPVSFQHVFASPGLYKIFAQFRPPKSKLPPDAALLADFWVKVEP